MTERTRKELFDYARKNGVYVETWSPGDGVIRYRFFSEPADYFGGKDSIKLYTALGLKEANTWLRGYVRGKGQVIL